MGWSGPLGSARPSMVVTLAPSICQTKTVQAFTALPSTCTTQAPHWDVSQPTWVPVSRRFSRKYCTRRVRGSTSPVTALPFTVNATAVMASSSKSFFAPTREAGGGSGQSRGDFALGPTFEQVNSEPAAHHRSRVPFSFRLRHRSSELDEEVVGGLLRGAVDEALTKLGELAADLRLHVIGEQRTAVLVAERHLGAAFGKAGHPALPFAGNAVAVRRIEVGEADLALPARLDRADFDRGDGLEFVIRDLFELLAAGDAAFEHLGVVELGPDHLAVGGELDLPIHRHRHRPSPSFLAS